MNVFSPRSFSTCLPIITLAFLTTHPVLAQKNETAKVVVSHASLIVSVIDGQGAAIDGVDVCIMQWTGKMEPYLPSKAISKEGHFYIDNLDTEKMFYLRVMADGFASSMQSLLSLTPGETRTIQFKLSRPAMGWIDVVNPDGKPIEGARIAMLKYSDANKNDVYVTPETADSVGFQLASSDANGRLELPQLPKNCKCSVTIFHPDWLVGKSNDVAIVDGRMSSLRLTAGVRVECNLKQLAGDIENFDGKLVKVKMYSHSRSKTNPTDFIASVPVRRNRVSFSACPVDYSQLMLEMDSHILGPNLFNFPGSTDAQLDLSSGQPKVFEFRAQRKVKVKGAIDRYAWARSLRCLRRQLHCGERSNTLAIGNERKRPCCCCSPMDKRW